MTIEKPFLQSFHPPLPPHRQSTGWLLHRPAEPKLPLATSFGFCPLTRRTRKPDFLSKGYQVPLKNISAKSKREKRSSLMRYKLERRAKHQRVNAIRRKRLLREKDSCPWCNGHSPNNTNFNQENEKKAGKEKFFVTL